MKDRLLVVVPMKDPAASKTRLSDVLSDADRCRFAKVLFRRTLATLMALKPEVDFKIAVVTSSDAIAVFAESVGATVIAEGHPQGLNPALSLAADWAASRGFERMCVLPADLAAPDPIDLARLLDTSGISVCPSVDLGTNALVVPLPCPMEFAFGPGSFAAHIEAARSAGVTARLLPLESLRYDIDTSEGLVRAGRVAPDLARFAGV